ncbi:MAG TPA: 23S rRNA (uracil(1939)-C(5))-methyltransferase RlmD [Bacteroidales bacterium]|nr:23S rRNA (uracil(1939)-C(5))-methyltransferase RlmD [Bacteroidales bacterium]HPS16279.1 23S rRNA (uracil(1939)-C(5))-methyltransferase RlmD [Bacteroidales bacterium]
MNERNEIIEGLEILDIADEGKAVARHNDMVVFVSGAVPGDIADVKITKRKRNFLEGKIEKLIKSSDNRTQPFCKHFGICGGCKWQHLSYEAQLNFKQKHVVDCIQRIAGINPDGIMHPILKCNEQKYYRNKLEFTFSDRRFLTDEDDFDAPKELNGLGFHVPGRFDKVLDINECFLQRHPSNAIRNEIRIFALKNNYEFFGLRKQNGFLRNIIIRTTQSELMLIIVFHHEDNEKRIALLDHISSAFPGITSLMYVINPKRNDIITDLEIMLYKGNPFITEHMEDLVFKVSPVSFFQTNSNQAYELYKMVREYAGLTGNETVYDLYTGTGTIANFIAGKSKKVIGIEYVQSAVEDAKENSKINGISNTDFFAGDMVKVLNDDFIKLHGAPDVVITDPPRMGMHKDVVMQLLKILPQRIVYVSCNPSTQARDIEILKEKYDLVKFCPVDMFPHTQHVENVTLLEKIKS